MFGDECGHLVQGVRLVQGIVGAQEVQPCPRRHPDASVQRVIDILVAAGMDNQTGAEAGGEAVCDVKGSVRRAAVNQEHLEVAAGLAGNAVEAGIQDRRRVQRGDDDRKHWRSHGANHASRQVNPVCRFVESST